MTRRIGILGAVHVAPHPDPADRRVTLLALTPKGEQAFAVEKDFYRALIDQALAGLGPAARDDVLDALVDLDPTGLANWHLTQPPSCRAPSTRQSPTFVGAC